MVSSVLQVPILPAVFPLFLPQPDQSAFFFFYYIYFTKILFVLGWKVVGRESVPSLYGLL